ncbi:hypothetical protein CN692_11990 [Bacillus sp. AFS002410]|uniref:CPCC family cysteine-rich protein n=1 Tax=Bacillus sp. AFS002410 TaxID=2033481 RepID=UPI000BEFB8E4|nr:CPCC family cysteine-rich protein [Bacillus sp. AFS002410]PEJ57801.1 hypothetical protein CN692_11990 [Bacillus sp. AFS002410]
MKYKDFLKIGINNKGAQYSKISGVSMDITLSKLQKVNEGVNGMMQKSERIEVYWEDVIDGREYVKKAITSIKEFCWENWNNEESGHQPSRVVWHDLYTGRSIIPRNLDITQLQVHIIRILCLLESAYSEGRFTSYINEELQKGLNQIYKTYESLYAEEMAAASEEWDQFDFIEKKKDRAQAFWDGFTHGITQQILEYEIQLLNERLDHVPSPIENNIEDDEELEGNYLKYNCPCCGYQTLEERCVCDICILCNWEDLTSIDCIEGTEVDEPNENSFMAEARKNFKENYIMYSHIKQTSNVIEAKKALISAFNELDKYKKDSIEYKEHWIKINRYKHILSLETDISKIKRDLEDIDGEKE